MRTAVQRSGAPGDPPRQAVPAAARSRYGAAGHAGAGRTRPGRLAVLGWSALLVIAVGWGQLLLHRGRMYFDHFPPFHSSPRLPGWSMTPALVVAAAAVGVLPWLTRRLRWRTLLAACWLAAACWAVALAVSDGTGHLSGPLRSRFEYFASLPAVGNHPLHWLATFAAELPHYSVQVAGHPPLPELMLWGLARIGLGGAGWAAALIIAAGTSAVAAVAITVRELAGEAAARGALPFLVLAPAAVYLATSMDALFLGVTAWGVAALAVAARRGSATLGFCAGALLGMLPYLSYGLLPAGALAAAVLWPHRPRRPHRSYRSPGPHRPPGPHRALRALGGTLAAVAVIAAAFTAAGFCWPSGVAATHTAWLHSAGAYRPQGYFVVGDLAVLAAVTGPATAVALARLRDPRLWLICGAALVAVLALDASGTTRGEVERIWLPYVPWLIAATGGLRPLRHRWLPGALTAQALTGLALQAFLLSPW